MSKKQWGHGFFNGYKKGLNSCGMDEHGELICPNCESEYLHHYRTEVFERIAEDEENGFVVTVGNGVNISTSPDDMLRNPSDRRDGVRIFFFCEECDVVSALILKQHKGNSFLGFVKTDREKDRAEPYCDGSAR